MINYQTPDANSHACLTNIIGAKHDQELHVHVLIAPKRLNMYQYT